MILACLGTYLIPASQLGLNELIPELSSVIRSQGSAPANRQEMGLHLGRNLPAHTVKAPPQTES